MTRSTTVHYIKGDEQEWGLAAHEPPGRPGILKRVLATREHFPIGQLQMINWARLPKGTRSWPHYHQDLHEAFFCIDGTVEFRVKEETLVLHRGDLVVVPPDTVHVLVNIGDGDAELCVVGISEGKGGKTVMLEHEDTR